MNFSRRYWHVLRLPRREIGSQPDETHLGLLTLIAFKTLLSLFHRSSEHLNPTMEPGNDTNSEGESDREFIAATPPPRRSPSPIYVSSDSEPGPVPPRRDGERIYTFEKREEFLPDGTRKVEQVLRWVTFEPPSRNVIIEEIPGEPNAPEGGAMDSAPQRPEDVNPTLEESFSDLSVNGGADTPVPPEEPENLCSSEPRPMSPPSRSNEDDVPIASHDTNAQDADAWGEHAPSPRWNEADERPLSLSPSQWSLDSLETVGYSPAGTGFQSGWLTRRPDDTVFSPVPRRGVTFAPFVETFDHTAAGAPDRQPPVATDAGGENEGVRRTSRSHLPRSRTPPPPRNNQRQWNAKPADAPPARRRRRRRHRRRRPRNESNRGSSRSVADPDVRSRQPANRRPSRDRSCRRRTSPQHWTPQEHERSRARYPPEGPLYSRRSPPRDEQPCCSRYAARRRLEEQRPHLIPDWRFREVPDTARRKLTPLVEKAVRETPLGRTLRRLYILPEGKFHVNIDVYGCVLVSAQYLEGEGMM